jgi:glycosyltransferase involved in cell wall biosynthesis
MKSEPNISVVLPCFNGEKTIQKCLQSINNQNCRLELIFVDDGSMDQSMNIFKNFNFHSNITVKYITRGNKGFLYSLDEGIKLASGDYIARIDSDDIWLDFHIQKIMHKFVNNNNLVLIGSQAIKINEFDEIIGSYSVPCSQNDIIKYLHKDSAFIHSSVVFKKNVYMLTPGYFIGSDPVSNLIGDYNLWFELTKLGSVENIPEQTLHYRVLNNSMSRVIKRHLNYSARYLIMKRVNRYYRSYFFYSLLQRIKVKIRMIYYIIFN